jgi:hypothetical protein
MLLLALCLHRRHSVTWSWIIKWHINSPVTQRLERNWRSVHGRQAWEGSQGCAFYFFHSGRQNARDVALPAWSWGWAACVSTVPPVAKAHGRHRPASRSIGMPPFLLPFRHPMEQCGCVSWGVLCFRGGGRRSAASETPFPFLPLWLDLD